MGFHMQERQLSLSSYLKNPSIMPVVNSFCNNTLLGYIEPAYANDTIRPISLRKLQSDSTAYIMEC